MDHESTRRNYDTLSRWYDLLEGGWERKPRKAAIANLADFEGCKILEVGCGTGNSLLDIGRIAGKNGTVLGVDLSAGMLQQAQKKIRKNSESPRIFLGQAEALTLPFPKVSFEVVFMSFTLELFSPAEITAVLAECSRVLAPGGQLALVAISRSCGQNTITTIYEFLHRVLPHVVDCAPIDAAGYVYQAGFSLRNRQTFSLFGIGVEVIVATEKAGIS